MEVSVGVGNGVKPLAIYNKLNLQFASIAEHVQAHMLNVGQSSTSSHKKHTSKGTQTNTVHSCTLKPPCWRFDD